LIDLDQGGEIAMKFGFDESGEVQIEGYSAQRNNEGFSADELRTLYLLASKEDEAMHKDETAAQLLQQYASQFSLDGGFNSPATCEVYSLETLKRRNKSAWHLVLFCDFLGPVFIQWESASTSEVLLLALGTLAR
jgi:hypothetical protein